jgi:uncharacterized protein (DUF2235 family)
MAPPPPSLPTLRRPNKLVVLCDGTWCGRETGTESNISLLATAIGIPDSAAVTDKEPRAYVDDSRRLKACYFAGSGLGGTFLDYLFNGATGSDIGQDCQAVYRYIVDNYDDQTEIWMFGFSRGAFTLRCVAGMINNCGIVKALPSGKETSLLVEEVYSIYRSPYEDDAPGEPRAQAFRTAASWPVESPIAVMCIIDTVGSKLLT